MKMMARKKTTFLEKKKKNRRGCAKGKSLSLLRRISSGLLEHLECSDLDAKLVSRYLLLSSTKLLVGFLFVDVRYDFCIDYVIALGVNVRMWVFCEVD